MSNRDRWLSRTVDIALIAVLLVVAARLFAAPQSPQGRPAVEDVEAAHWELALDISRPIHDTPSADVMIEFMDFECPFCQRWGIGLDSMIAAGDVSVDVRLIHLPLPNHPHAMPAAIAFECAARWGKGTAMYRELLRGAADFGTRPWRDYAIAVGVSEMDDFDECITLPGDNFLAIRDGLKLAKAAGVTSTPGIWINGKYVHDRADATIRSLLSER